MKNLYKPKYEGYFKFLIPAIIVCMIFIIYPMISSFYYSMTNWNGFTNEIEFTGFKNFITLFNDQRLKLSLLNNLKIVLMTILLQNGISLILALILDGQIKTKNILRTLIFLPIVLSPLVISYIWSYMYNYDMGIISNVLDFLKLGILKKDWLGDPGIAIYAVTWVSIWQWIGFQMVIYLAAMQNIPTDVIEAAKIDGSGYFKSIFNITLPLIAPAFTINVILTTIGGLKTFDTIFVMTRGGPGFATDTITMNMYSQAFTNNRMGYGAAIGLILFALILIITLFQIGYLRRREIEL